MNKTTRMTSAFLASLITELFFCHLDFSGFLACHWRSWTQVGAVQRHIHIIFFWRDNRRYISCIVPLLLIKKKNLRMFFTCNCWCLGSWFILSTVISGKQQFSNSEKNIDSFSLFKKRMTANPKAVTGFIFSNAY